MIKSFIYLISYFLLLFYYQDFHFRNALRDILIPYLSFDKEKDDHVTILDVISQTINCIIFLSVKNVSFFLIYILCLSWIYYVGQYHRF